MGKFKEGDRVVDAYGNIATVSDTFDLVNVLFEQFSNNCGIFAAENFELYTPIRKFEAGDYVRIAPSDIEFGNEVGMVFEDDGDDEENMPYSVGFYDELESENSFSASELLPWVPLVGDRVVTTDDEDEVGTVIGLDNSITARVLWDEYPVAQGWLISELEPADEYEEHFKIGDEVVYSSPFLSDPLRAVVTHTEGESLGVAFPSNPGMTGIYHQNFFSKAA